MHLPRQTFRSCAAALIATSVLLVGGCGGGSSDDASGSNDVGAGALVHVDGTVKVSGDTFVLQPTAKGGEPITFTYGPEVQPAAVSALGASGAEARVSYRLSEDDPVAVSVAPAPEIPEGMSSYVGQVESVDQQRIVVKGSDGERTFTIAAADAAAFDVPHLRDHAKQGTSVRIYFDPKDADAGVAYEDA